MKLDAQRGTRIHAYISVSTYMVFHRRVHLVPWDVVFHNEWFCGPTIDYRDYRLKDTDYRSWTTETTD